ncbi:hypothetical protein SAMD00023353_0402320 [Rosellinia necatrix]|uniref:Uncharacterized protein n=1 Tax=Rosellinia necatrix TaxID=77044 RepID=A0A1S8A5N1_ROSNE|nr:hypothetical protein SAMD00023353_0402320 [Rosellinia necatrix]
MPVTTSTYPSFYEGADISVVMRARESPFAPWRSPAPNLGYNIPMGHLAIEVCNYISQPQPELQEDPSKVRRFSLCLSKLVKASSYFNQ